MMFEKGPERSFIRAYVSAEFEFCEESEPSHHSSSRGGIIMCKVIAIANQKGGVSKTCTCVNLGAALVRSGRKVCVLDADPHGNLTQSLGFRNQDEMSGTLSECLSRVIQMDETLPDSDTSDNFPQKPITSGVILRSAEGLDLIPGNIELAGMEVSMVNLIGREIPKFRNFAKHNLVILISTRLI